MVEFFAICEYFDISPIEFFQGSSDPLLLRQAAEGLENLSREDLEFVQKLVERLAAK